MQAPRGKQLKIRGNIVNVPAEVTSTFTMLPRLPSETATIKVNLKRKLQYKSCASSRLADEKQQSISGKIINPQWANQYDKEIEQQNMDDPCSGQTAESVENSGETDDSNENEDEVPAGVTDNMLTATDCLEDERQHIVNIAPAEGNIPGIYIQG